MKITFPYRSYSFWSSKSSYPKDKVFAMLDLDSRMAALMGADYHDSVE